MSVKSGKALPYVSSLDLPLPIQHRVMPQPPFVPELGGFFDLFHDRPGIAQRKSKSQILNAVFQREYLRLLIKSKSPLAGEIFPHLRKALLQILPALVNNDDFTLSGFLHLSVFYIHQKFTSFRYSHLSGRKSLLITCNPGAGKIPAPCRKDRYLLILLG